MSERVRSLLRALRRRLRRVKWGALMLAALGCLTFVIGCAAWWQVFTERDTLQTTQNNVITDLHSQLKHREDAWKTSFDALVKLSCPTTGEKTEPAAARTDCCTKRAQAAQSAAPAVPPPADAGAAPK